MLKVANPWVGKVFDWKEAKTWLPVLSNWLKPKLSAEYAERIRSYNRDDLYIDDPEWLDILEKVLPCSLYDLQEELAKDIGEASVFAYHGCRVSDASTFFEDGILVNNPASLAEQVREIVWSTSELAHLCDNLEERLHGWDHANRDTGKIFLGLDDRELVEHAGHYCIYGSEWILAFLGFTGHPTLRQIGIPTVIKVAMPLSAQTRSAREQLAEKLLQEWTRLNAEQSDHVRWIDFSFMLRQNIPSGWVTDHFHPKEIPDPLYQKIIRRNHLTVCPACKSKDH